MAHTDGNNGFLGTVDGAMRKQNVQAIMVLSSLQTLIQLSFTWNDDEISPR